MKPIDIAGALNIGRATHEGMSGKHNEDYYGVFAWEMDDGRPFYLGVVADGIGGQNAGEVASRRAVKAIEEYFKELPLVNNVMAHLERAALSANEAVYQYSQENPQFEGMGTTIVLAAVLDGRLYTSHVGDSRIYFWRDNRLRQISVDHTWAQEAIEAGLLTKAQAKTHPNRNVIKRFLGSRAQIEVDQRLMWNWGQDAKTARGNQGLVLEPGDMVLLCSDGLTDMIDDAAVHQSIQTHFADLPQAASELIDKANLGGGKDNITVVIMQVPGGRVPLPVPVPAPATPVSQAESGQRWGLPVLLLAGAGLLGLLFILLLAGLFIFGNEDNNGQPTSAPTAVPALQNGANTEEATELPATAGLIMATVSNGDGSAGTATMEATSMNTPALIPTLRPTATPTRTRVPPSPTRTPTAENTATATTSSGGGNDNGSEPQPPQATRANTPTSPPPATNTPPPPPTQTPPIPGSPPSQPGPPPPTSATP